MDAAVLGDRLFWKLNFFGTCLWNFFGSRTFLELAFGTFLELKLFWNFSGTCLWNFFGSQTFLRLFWNLPLEPFGSQTFLGLAFGTFLEPSLFWNLPLKLFLPEFVQKMFCKNTSLEPGARYKVWSFSFYSLKKALILSKEKVCKSAKKCRNDFAL